MKFKTVFSIDTLEFGLRIFASIYICIYGLAKGAQFKGANLNATPINEASDAEVMWAFFGATATYPIAIGVLQVLGALLLLFRATKLIGSILLTPIFLNIIVLDILYHIHRGALVNAVLFQIIILFVMFRQRENIYRSFNQLLLSSTIKNNFGEKVVLFILAAVIAIVLALITPFLIKNLIQF